MKSFATRYPFSFALATTLLAMLCLMWPLWIPEVSQTALILLGRATICIFAVSLLTYLGWWRETGFNRPSSWRILIPFLPLFILIILAKISDTITVGIHVTDLWLILLGLIVYVAGGFMEEAVFRGLVLRALLPKGLLIAALLSAVIFALAHFLNLVLGANLGATILQVVVAFLAGLAFTAPLAVTRNIWPLVFIHGFTNFVGYLNVGGFLNTSATSKTPTTEEIIGQILPWLLLAIYSSWLILRTQKQAQKTQLAYSAASPSKEGLRPNP